MIDLIVSLPPPVPQPSHPPPSDYDAALRAFYRGRSERILTLFREYDRNPHDDKIDYEEFCKLIEHMLSTQYEPNKVQRVKVQVTEYLAAHVGVYYSPMNFEQFHILADHWLHLMSDSRMNEIGCSNFQSIDELDLLEKIRRWLMADPVGETKSPFQEVKVENRYLRDLLRFDLFFHQVM